MSDVRFDKCVVCGKHAGERTYVMYPGPVEPGEHAERMCPTCYWAGVKWAAIQTRILVSPLTHPPEKRE